MEGPVPTTVLGALISLCLALMALLGFIVRHVFLVMIPRIQDDLNMAVDKATKAAERTASLEVKVNTMWEFQLRRAEAEVVQKGLGSKNSPLIINDDAKDWLVEMAPQLRKFYVGVSDQPDSDVLLLLEKEFGAELMEKVCIPRGLGHGACLLIALAVAKG